uniref:Uncharacterized protein n=1 Tax=Oryza glumipatula TaxID=40148 RepID=A0A0D9YPZ3_9ORYZ
MEGRRGDFPWYGGARGAMVVQTVEERVDSLKNPAHGGERAREREEEMRRWAVGDAGERGAKARAA